MQRERETIHSSHVMPNILKLLKKTKRMKKKDIANSMRSVAAEKGLRFRNWAVDYALTLLQWKGWVSNSTRGFWSITTDGAGSPRLTKTHALEIGLDKETADKSQDNMPRRVLFARIGWMTYYSGLDDERPIGGGSYNKNRYGGEAFNFRTIHKTQLHGFFKAPGRDDNNRGVTNLDRIAPGITDDQLTEVLVIFVAPDRFADDREKRLKVIGWYKNATVFRVLQKLPTVHMWTLDERGNRKEVFYNVSGRTEDAILLPTNRRTESVPRGRSGIGQSNVRYLYDEHGVLEEKPWMRNIIEYVESYDNENLLNDPPSGSAADS
jgi:hypothetical protein